MKITQVKRPRTLRQYNRIAHQEHGPCHQCQHPIRPGDSYHAYVQVYNKKLLVSKYHDYCPDEWYREEEERDRQEQTAYEQEKWRSAQERPREKQRAA